MGDHDEYANPMLLDWVKEWLDTARERNSKGVTTYRTAYESLKACPITFQHPRQLTSLKGFGDKLTSRLTDMLKKHCEQNGLPMPKDPRHSKAGRPTAAAVAAGGADDDDDGRPKRAPRKVKPYVPAYRSGAYALILGLATLDEHGTSTLTKAELIELAQEHCDASFTAPSDPTKFYTAWNSIKTLVDKDYVAEKGRPLRRYSLTDEGWEVAKRIRQTASSGAVPTGQPPSTAASAGPSGVRQQTAPTSHFFDPSAERARSESVEAVEADPRPRSSFADVVADGAAVPDDASLPSITPIRLDPGTFTVQLLLDVREVRAKTDRDYMQQELAKKGVQPIMRSLELGDAQWVAVPNDPSALADGATEVVLDWIVERKRLDDLISSIKDGRFHEQKFRLGRSGVRNVVYIIEDIALDASHVGRYEESVQSAIAATQVVNGYFVKKTLKMDDTIRYLARMTATLKRLVEPKPLFVIPTRDITAKNYLPLLRHLRAREPTHAYHITYPAFASLASKSDMMTLRDVFLKMLMTTRGVTGEKALEIQKHWRTPRDFVKAFEACGSGEAGRKRKFEMVANATSALVGRKKIAKAVSQRIAEVWGEA
ncbi:crossover junction endonuclease MUS81 [Plectosphaerella plurivora]|uniref:Crossover junction endonuclease MUS81 n=1 Tax=Plectosphaerella plurivora TaxID=936078 RepID=A0A9P8VHG5_9PEZI|nr:crossover junction endonuclease MUS81 [Plectosphaerella plurivora]